MTTVPPILRESGENWSFAYDLSSFPDYVLLTLRGQPEPQRTRRLIEVAQAHQAELTLPSGVMCPLIVDRRLDSIPSPATLRAARALLDQSASRLSCIIFLVDPMRQDRLLMDVALDILSAFSSVRIAVAGSLEEAVAKVAAHRAPFMSTYTSTSE